MSGKYDLAKGDKDFWDLSDAVLPKKTIGSFSKSTDTVDVTYGNDFQEDAQNKFTDSTVIKRYIPPHTSMVQASEDKRLDYEYSPTGSLIHKVRLYRLTSSYSFYEEFCRTARESWNVVGTPCDYQEFFSYSPQYDQMNSNQKAYYFWWRENLRKGNCIKTNLCYISLYFFELINSDGAISPQQARALMISVVKNYSDVLRGAVSKYLKWICDYSMIHRLPAPEVMDERLLNSVNSLKEYFVRVGGDTPDGWADVLLRYCCSYDYRTSKFAINEALSLYDTHVRGAVADCVRYLSGSGGILSKLSFEDCRLTAKAYDGAVCSAENRYIIEVEYCSFSRSHELRFLVGDIVKHCENKIRAHLSIKSRLTVYSLPNDLKEVIDSYFSKALPPSSRVSRVKEEKHEYDVLYDLPKAKLDLSRAAEIELESWNTTKELVEAFESEESSRDLSLSIKEPLGIKEKKAENREEDRFGEYYCAIECLVDGDMTALRQLAREKNKPLDAVVDEINEIAVDLIGDIIIEGDDGSYRIVEDYIDDIVRRVADE